MKLILAVSLSTVLLSGQELTLPEWDEAELEALESGEYVPGSSLLGRVAREFLDSNNDEPIELDPAVRNLQEEGLAPVEWSRVIGDQFLSAYFHDSPQGFLNDPQKLLTTQEYRDREGFLNYHARDADIDLFVYLFDALQEIPETESLDSVVRSQFDPEKPVAVVFYFLGMPEKSQLIFSDRVIKSVNQAEREKVIRIAVEEALEKSDPSSQLESFSIQLSIRLYWLGKVIAMGGENLASSTPLILPRIRILEAEDAGVWAELKGRPGLFYAVVVMSVIISASGLGLMGRWIAERRRVYVFPDAEGTLLLEAPYAAGVGGVVSFSSATAPPSIQKNDILD